MPCEQFRRAQLACRPRRAGQHPGRVGRRPERGHDRPAPQHGRSVAPRACSASRAACRWARATAAARDERSWRGCWRRGGGPAVCSLRLRRSAMARSPRPSATRRSTSSSGERTGPAGRGAERIEGRARGGGLVLGRLGAPRPSARRASASPSRAQAVSGNASARTAQPRRRNDRAQLRDASRGDSRPRRKRPLRAAAWRGADRLEMRAGPRVRGRGGVVAGCRPLHARTSASTGPAARPGWRRNLTQQPLEGGARQVRVAAGEAELRAPELRERVTLGSPNSASASSSRPWRRRSSGRTTSSATPRSRAIVSSSSAEASTRSASSHSPRQHRTTPWCDLAGPGDEADVQPPAERLDLTAPLRRA